MARSKKANEINDEMGVANHKNQIYLYRDCSVCGARFRTYKGNRYTMKETCSYRCAGVLGKKRKLISEGRAYLAKNLKAQTPVQKAFKSYKSGAKERGIRFSLKIDEFAQFWGKTCFYCGFEKDTNGIDRIDSKLGYVHENIQSCCKWCNWMKNKRSSDEFIKHCTKVAIKQATPIATYNVSTDNNEAKIRED